MNTHLIKIGLVGLFHRNARGDAEAYTRAACELRSLGEKNGFETYVVDAPVYGYDDATRAVEELNAHSPDFTFMFSASVTIGNAVIPFGKLRSRIGIWSVPEGTQSGFLPLNSFCGSMIFAGMLGKYLADYKIPFKWFYGYTDNPLFKNRFPPTLKALRAMARLRNTRLACVGPLVDGFDYMQTDEARLESLYGIRVERLHSVEEIIALAEKQTTAAVREELAAIRKEGRQTGAVDDAAMERFARLCLALRNFVQENSYSALAISCWRRLQENYNVVACGAIGRLNNAGVVASCEGDVDGAIGMLIDSAFNNGRPASMVDVVSLDQDDASINIWHCGPAPACMADAHGVNWDQHFNMGCYRDGEWKGCGAVADLRFRPGVVTLNRICSRTREMTVFTGDLFEKPSYQGSSGWLRNFRSRGKPVSLPELLSLFYRYRVDHHLSFGYGDNEDAFREFAAWKGLTVCESGDYVDYLET